MKDLLPRPHFMLTVIVVVIIGRVVEHFLTGGGLGAAAALAYIAAERNAS